MDGRFLKCPHCRSTLPDAPFGRLYVCSACRRCVVEPLRRAKTPIGPTLPSPSPSPNATFDIPTLIPPRLPFGVDFRPSPFGAPAFGWTHNEVLSIVSRHLVGTRTLFVMPDIPTDVEARVRARFEPCLDDDEILLAVHEPVYDEPDGCVAVTRHQLCWNSRIEGPTRLAWSSFSPSAVIVTSEALRVNNEEIHDVSEDSRGPLAELLRHLAALAMIPP